MDELGISAEVHSQAMCERQLVFVSSLAAVCWIEAWLGQIDECMWKASYNN